MNRCCILFGLILIPFGLQKGLGDDRPNILVVLTDDQRFDALGVVQRELGSDARFPFLETPNLDRLAESGVRFRNSFVTHSLCSPSRATLLTGLPTHRHGIRDNQTPFRSGATWPVALQAAGYRTGYFGKWHMGNQADRPGFDDVVTYRGQGDYFGARLLKNGDESIATEWVDDAITSSALDFIRDNRRSPFAMVIGFKSPHDPRLPPARYADLWEGIGIAEPPTFRDFPPFRPKRASDEWNAHSLDRMNYFRCLRGVDDNVGRILDALEETGLAENTLVIYFGDNGYYLGEHGLGDKRTAYEESLRIPLLIRGPSLFPSGRVVDAIALNLDLAQTILEAANVRVEWPLEGRSLLPLLRGEEPVDWRREFLYESYRDPAYADVTFDVFALRTLAAKIIVYPDHPDWTQVFDLRSDPLELHNLVGVEGARERVSDLERRLDERLREVGFGGGF